jgi:Flp pilus assembly protein CpaB
MAGNTWTDRLTTTRGGAIALGVAAAILAAILLTVYITMYRDSVSSNTTPTPVLVAKRLIARGTPGSVIGVKQLYENTTVAKDSVEAGAINDPALLNGRVAAVDIFPGQQLTDADFVVGGAATGVAATLGRSLRAVSIEMDPLRGSLANLQTGDHVDIYQQLQSGTGTIVKLFRANVPVLQAPGGVTEGGSNIVILEVATRDVSDVLYAAQHTQLSFALRPTQGAGPTVPRTASQATMLQYNRTH